MAKGKLHVRLPVELHEALAVEAANQGVSLNTWIVTLLANRTEANINEGGQAWDLKNQP